jgi:hypothetical protein
MDTVPSGMLMFSAFVNMIKKVLMHKIIALLLSTRIDNIHRG